VHPEMVIVNVRPHLGPSWSKVRQNGQHGFGRQPCLDVKMNLRDR
jgi:hypothetical protein